MLSRELRELLCRFNGYGYAIGTGAGILAAILSRVLGGNIPEYYFFIIASASSGMMVIMKRWNNVFILLVVFGIFSVVLYFNLFRHLSDEDKLEEYKNLNYKS